MQLLCEEWVEGDESVYGGFEVLLSSQQVTNLTAAFAHCISPNRYGSLWATGVSLKSLHAFVIHGKCVFLMSSYDWQEVRKCSSVSSCSLSKSLSLAALSRGVLLRAASCLRWVMRTWSWTWFLHVTPETFHRPSRFLHGPWYLCNWALPALGLGVGEGQEWKMNAKRWDWGMEGGRTKRGKGEFPGGVSGDEGPMSNHSF